MNKALDEIRNMLIIQMNKLSKKLGDTSDPEIAGAIFNEMQEVNHRLNLVQRLIFIDESDLIEKRVPALRESNRKLLEELSNLGRITKFVNAVTSFLKIVDEVIDIAKLVPV